MTCSNIRAGLACIKINSMHNLAADKESSNYPVENVLDDHPKRKWRADTTGDATITFGTDSGSNCIAIFGTNADLVFVTLTDPNGIEWEEDVTWEAGVEWSNTEFISDQNYNLSQQGDTFALWLDFDNPDSALEVSIRFRSTINKIIEVWVIRCGISFNVGVNPIRPINENLVDYSIIKELSNGATYVKKRDIVREFSGGLHVERERTFYDYMYGIVRPVGQIPLAWKISDLNTTDWIVFGRLNGMPSGSHVEFLRSTINFKIIEVL